MKTDLTPMFDVTVRVDGHTYLRTGMTLEERERFVAGFGDDAEVEVRPATAQLIRASFC